MSCFSSPASAIARRAASAYSVRELIARPRPLSEPTPTIANFRLSNAIWTALPELHRLVHRTGYRRRGLLSPTRIDAGPRGEFRWVIASLALGVQRFCACGAMVIGKEFAMRKVNEIGDLIVNG